ncbi:MAG: mechanosensitive ion channel family protein [Oscillatoriophycideae cyanobacterium NC_groundwater_1537_Pr4_S-0.65um_50_18]|nr:mechanosensitive ion channel family protein [Oscillatoriophycideae cyanobacterium NC_groundwater_1537_Pr4_S-0.65um_50_18]
MNSVALQSNLLGWVVALVIGFPLLVIVLGESIHRLKRRGKPLAATLRLVRNLILPVLAFLLFMQHVLKLDTDGRWVKSIETLLWVCVIHAALSLLNVILFEQAEADTWRSKVPKLLIDLARLLLILLGSAIVLATVWNADLAGLATALGVSSIVIGLALQDTLGSVTSGIALLFERPFSVGDWLQIGETVGQVTDINWRAVRLQTLEREMVVIPHKVIGGETIRNFSQPQRLHAERIQIGFSYNDPPNLAKQVLKSTALATQGILTHPEPQIFTLSYDDFAVTYEVKFFIQDYGGVEEIRDRFMTRVWYAAQRNNLSIPFPIRTVYHFHGPTSQTKGLSKKVADSLQSIPAYVPLDEEDGQSLSQGIVLQHFGVGERVIRQGDAGNALYIIVSGQAVLLVVDDLNQEHEVLPLKAGEFFGEMALFSGESSPVSVVAADDLEVMMISSSVVNQMIERQPSFAREIGQILEIRRRAIQAAKQVPSQS